MKLTHAPPGAPLAIDETAADERLRALVSAWGVVSARVLVDRAMEGMEAEGDPLRALLRDRLDALEDCGDVLAGPRGMVAAGPVMEVEMAGGRRLLVGGVPDGVIREVFPDIAIAPGAPRCIERGADAGAVAARFEGVTVSGARWAGLDAAPRCDDALLAALGQRAEALAAEGALEPLDGSAERYLTSAERGARRRRWGSDLAMGLPSLVRWTGLSPEPRFGWATSLTQVLPLGRDEALRAMWALERAAGNAPAIVLDGDAATVVFALDARLPGAEYRYLVASACSCAWARDGARWTVPRAAWPEVSAMLRDRLGIDWSGA